MKSRGISHRLAVYQTLDGAHRRRLVTVLIITDLGLGVKSFSLPVFIFFLPFATSVTGCVTILSHTQTKITRF